MTTEEAAVRIIKSGDWVELGFGVAMLKGKTLKKRANELIAVAHPDFRGWLREEAKKINLI